MLGFAEKLNYLIEKTGKSWMSYPQLAEAISDKTQAKIDGNYMWKLCKGKVPNPRLATIQQLAEYFGVEPSYFTDSSNDEKNLALLDLLESMRNAEVQNLGARAAGLSPKTIKWIADTIDNARELEGLDPVPGSDEEANE